MKASELIKRIEKLCEECEEDFDIMLDTDTIVAYYPYELLYVYLDPNPGRSAIVLE